MLPSTGDKLTLPLSPLPPSEPFTVSNTPSEEVKSESFAPTPTATPPHTSSEVKYIYYSLKTLILPLNLQWNGVWNYFFLSFQPDGPLGFSFPMDSEINSDFKLDLVEKFFAIDPESKPRFNTQVRFCSCIY